MDQQRVHETQPEIHSREFLRGTTTTAIAKIAGVGIGLGFNIVLTRQLGAAQTGIFFLSIALITIASVLSRLGFDKSILKYASKNILLAEWSAVKAIYLYAIKTVTFVSLVVSAVLVFCGPWLATEVFGKADLPSVIQMMALGITPLSLLNLHCQFIKSARLIGLGFFIQNSAISLLLLVALLLNPAGSAYTLAALYSMAALIAFFVVLWLWFNVSQLNSIASISRGGIEDFRRSSNSLYVAAIVNMIILPWSSMVLLGIFGTPEDAGQFGVVLRLASLVNFSYLVVESAVGPKFAELFAKGDPNSIRLISGRATMLMVAFATPVSSALLLFPEYVLEWFGSGFAGGAVPLMILTSGQLVNVLTGSVANLLIMGGHEKDYRSTTIIAGFVNVFAGIVLIPSNGSIGAAWATALAVASMNLVAFALVRWRLGFMPLPGWRRSGKD